MAQRVSVFGALARELQCLALSKMGPVVRPRVWVRQEVTKCRLQPYIGPNRLILKVQYARATVWTPVLRSSDVPDLLMNKAKALSKTLFEAREIVTGGIRALCRTKLQHVTYPRNARKGEAPCNKEGAVDGAAAGLGKLRQRWQYLSLGEIHKDLEVLLRSMKPKSRRGGVEGADRDQF